MTIKLFFAGFLGISLLSGCSHPQSTAATNPAAQAPNETSSAAAPVSQPANDSGQAANGDGPSVDSAAIRPSEAKSETTVPATSPGQRPADRTPIRPGEAEKITFEDLYLVMPADVVFRPFMLTDRVKELEGKRVSIAGYMHGGQDTQRGIKKFILLKNTECKFGPGGQADHLTDVWLRDGLTTNLTPKDVKVEGTFRIEPFVGPSDGNTWSIYRLEDAQIR